MQAAATSNLGSRVGSRSELELEGGWVSPGGAESKREGLESTINPAGSSASPSTVIPPSTCSSRPHCTHPRLSYLIIGGGKACRPKVQMEKERGSPAK